VARPSIVEQNYFEFKVALRDATNKGCRLEPKDKDRWKAWVRENKVQEAAFRSMAAQKFEDPQAVILDEEGPWGGYYLYTPTEEICLKWTWG
jgi:hypothetical protein